jgi:hypothetical protein
MSRVRAVLSASSGFSAILLLSGCGASTPGPSHPSMPEGATRSRPSYLADNPLVTEWPASEKANLEGRLREGGVVVEYLRGTLRLVPGCRVPGVYDWRRTTTSTDVIEIRDHAELEAKLPLGMASLSGELSRTGRLAVEMTVSGQRVLSGLSLADVPNDANCAGATHVVGALSVGAFRLRAGGTTEASTGVAVGSVGTQGSMSKEESILRRAGDPTVCAQASEEAPSAECASPLQVFLLPLPRFQALRGPSGTVQVAFLSGDTNRSWQVVAPSGVICAKTPCTRWVDPHTPITMRSPVPGTSVTETTEVPALPDRDEGMPIQVRAYPPNWGRVAGGATAVGAGAMALFFGLFIAGAKCGDDGSTGGCTTGWVLTGVSVPLIAGGVWLLTDFSAHADVTGGQASGGGDPWSRKPRLRVGGTF